MLEESNVSCWVPAKLHYAKERSVVHGIKRILNVQVQQDHRMLGVALILEKPLKLKGLTPKYCETIAVSNDWSEG